MVKIASWRWLNVSVFLASFLFSLPGVVRLTRHAIELAPLDYEERRKRELTEMYSSLRMHQWTLPAKGDVNVLLLGPNAIDRGVFINYHLYPRASHLYLGAIPADAPRRPLLVTEAYGPVRRTIVREPRVPGHAYREFIVPIVAAVQGGDGYMTEAVIEVDGMTAVTLTLMPSGATRTYIVKGQLILNDVVHESFGVMTAGWLRVRAEDPIRAGFWFVNRARAVAAPVPVVTHVPSMPQQFADGEKLFVLNPASSPVVARIDGREETIGAFALHVTSGTSVDAAQPLFAFTSSKMSDGNTRFVWAR